MDALVKALATLEVVDLVSHEPTLEDLFLEQYAPGGSDVTASSGGAHDGS